MQEIKENKEKEDFENDRKIKMMHGFAEMMDAIWGNDNGTKGLKKFLEQEGCDDSEEDK